jgi:transmembrane sensor
MKTRLPDFPFPSSDADWKLMARLLGGELPANEAAELRRRIEQDPGLAMMVASLERSPTGYSAQDVDVEAALRTVRSTMKRDSIWLTSPSQRIAFAPAPRASQAAGWLRIAAAVVGIAGLGWIAFPHDSAVSPAPVAAARTFATKTGQRDSVVLADGTRVTLGPGSTLTVPGSYPNDRRVELNGEARFDVKHDAAHSFSVHTLEATIADVGTVFTVQTYAGAGADVSVQEGAVELRSGMNAADNITLRAGEAGSITDNGKVLRAGQAESGDLPWMRGQLLFRDAPMYKVRAALRRWYGVELLSADPVIATRHLTASFEHETRSQILDIIAMALGAAFDVRGDTVILRAATGRGSR